MTLPGEKAKKIRQRHEHPGQQVRHRFLADLSQLQSETHALTAAGTAPSECALRVKIRYRVPCDYVVLLVRPIRNALERLKICMHNGQNRESENSLLEDLWRGRETEREGRQYVQDTCRYKSQ